MKYLLSLVAASIVLPSLRVRAAKLNPVEKTVELVSQLQAQVSADGEAEAAAYNKYQAWCADSAQTKSFDLKTANKDKDKFEAMIQKHTSDIQEASVNIEELSTAISSNEKKLKAATAVREQEAEAFKGTEQSLVEAVDMLQRSIHVLEKEMAKAPSLLQRDSSTLDNVLTALTTIVDAGGIEVEGSQELMALLQQRQGSDTDDMIEELGAPDAAAYQSHSKNIIDIMGDLQEKAETELRKAQEGEANAQHNFQMLKNSLSMQIDVAKKGMDEEKSSKSASSEAKATAEGNLEVTIKELKEAEDALKHIRTTCLERAADHERTIAGRKAELLVLMQAKKKIQATMIPTFVQVSTSRKRMHQDARTQAAVKAVKRLAAEQHSQALAQLASRLTAASRFGADPFAKIRGLITDMIKRLEKELQEDAAEKAYCDREMSRTKKRKAELEDEASGLKGKIDQAASNSAALKTKVKDLHNEVGKIGQLQKEMDTARADTHAAFQKSKNDLQAGLDSMREAIRLLREYYASDDEGASFVQEDDSMAAEMDQPAPPEKFKKSSGAGGGIIGFLEVCESDIAKNLAEEETEENASQAEYDKLTQENKLAKASLEKDIEYKTKEFKGLDKAITELSADFDTASQELDAVKQYLAQVMERCVAKPEKYTERKERRDKEIRGLKEALSMLEGEGTFLQRRQRPS